MRMVACMPTLANHFHFRSLQQRRRVKTLTPSHGEQLWNILLHCCHQHCAGNMEGTSMARWNRAIAALPFQCGRVLDLGCAFGFTTLKLARKGYQTVGVDNSARYIAQAKRRHPTGEYILCSAETLPLADASFDGVLFLDVLEHGTNQRAVVSEIHRILKPGGTLVISVPHRGLLGWLDSLNLYAHLVRQTHHGLFPSEIAQTGVHRHYSKPQLCALLGSAFTV